MLHTISFFLIFQETILPIKTPPIRNIIAAYVKKAGDISQEKVTLQVLLRNITLLMIFIATHYKSPLLSQLSYLLFLHERYNQNACHPR